MQPWSERPLFWHLASTYINPPCSIIRRGDWKLIQYLRDGELELYNLADDLRESTNRATSQPETAQRLLSELIDWRRMNQVPLPPSSTLSH